MITKEKIDALRAMKDRRKVSGPPRITIATIDALLDTAEEALCLREQVEKLISDIRSIKAGKVGGRGWP